MAYERDVSPLARLMGALGQEKIGFLLIGMSAAIVQGVPGSTLDVDLWIDLPERQHMRPVKVALAQDARMLRNTVIELSDETLVNFVYKVTGLGSFAEEQWQRGEVIVSRIDCQRIASGEHTKKQNDRRAAQGFGACASNREHAETETRQRQGLVQRRGILPTRGLL